jgi:NADH:ubiquinone oxidoreductase subunit 2 (subunit N)
MNLSYATNTNEMSLLQGLYQKTPLVAVTIFIAAASLFGLPITLGFIAKWSFIETIIQADIVVLAIILFGSLITLAYFVKIIEFVYYPGVVESTIQYRKLAIGENLILIILVSIIIYLAVEVEIVYSIASKISNLLFLPVGV